MTVAMLTGCVRISLLLRYSGLVDHFAPFGAVASHAVPHLFGGASARLDAERAELLFHVRRREALVDLGIEKFYYFVGHGRACADAVPAGDEIIRKAALPGGRNVHEHVIALLAGRGHYPHPAGA